MDSELEFAIQPNTTGKQLFDQVETFLWELFYFIILIRLLKRLVFVKYGFLAYYIQIRKIFHVGLNLIRKSLVKILKKLPHHKY